MNNITDIYDVWAPVWWQQRSTWVFFLVGIIVCVVIFWLYIQFLRKPKKPLTKLEQALQEFAQFDTARLCTQEEQKNFYSALITLTKIYLVERHAADVMSKTDNELREYLLTEKNLSEIQDIIIATIDHAQMVKFAGDMAIRQHMESDRVRVIKLVTLMTA